MTFVISELQLAGTDRVRVERFIQGWRKTGDLPCSRLELDGEGDSLSLRLHYPLTVFDRSVTQFLAVLFGELSFLRAFGEVRFQDLTLPEEVYRWFDGPRFGQGEVLGRFHVGSSPLLVAILKPALGAGLGEIEEKIGAVLESGFHAVKDDEMQGDLPTATLADRLRLCGKYDQYIPVVNLDCVSQYEDALSSLPRVPGMILVNASAMGFPMLHQLRRVLAVPILSHVSLQGIFHRSFTPRLFARMHRLFGCDAFITPIGDVNYFSVHRHDESEMVRAFTEDLPIRKTLPVLTGGLRVHNLPDVIGPYHGAGTPYGLAFGAQVFCASEGSPSDACRKIVERVQQHRSQRTACAGLVAE